MKLVSLISLLAGFLSPNHRFVVPIMPPNITAPTIIIASPTPSPLPISQQNQLYGPCVSLPVLFYHHIQPESVAKAEGQQSLNVDTSIFQKQMEYLHQKNYHSIKPQDLINFFDQNTPLPPKPVLITFDDAYADFATDAAPFLIQYGFTATVFVPTGLVNNPHYLSWSTIDSLSGQGFVFANHTWSHHSLKDSLEVVAKELNIASTQLTEHHQTPNVFAYPYGTISHESTQYLSDNHYLLAFTTKNGLSQCRQQRLLLPRIRIGNRPLSSYGL